MLFNVYELRVNSLKSIALKPNDLNKQTISTQNFIAVLYCTNNKRDIFCYTMSTFSKAKSIFRTLISDTGDFMKKLPTATCPLR